jgi:DNA polymerase
MTAVQQIAALLRYYEALGVDATVADSAVDLTAIEPVRRAAGAPQRQPAPEPGSGPEPGPDPGPKPGRGGPLPVPGQGAPAARRPPPRPAAPALIDSDTATADARALADSADTLAELENAVRAFEGCPLKATATNTVFSDGNREAELMIVGEAPGAEEDRQGLPFVGPAGQLLDRMLAAIGRDRTSTYITNILFWRPPGNRPPNSNEIAVCLPFVERHIALKHPRVLVLAGNTSAKALLGTSEGITKLRGRWADLSVPGLPAPVPTVAIYHPSYLLRTPAMKRQAWRDLIAIRRRLEQAAG